MDRAKHLLLESLRGGVDHAELRLYRAGKFPGLFTGRTSLHTELAQHALSQGLIEIVRTDTKGKSPVEWVRVTPKGVDLVLQAENPVRAIEELRSLMELNQNGHPHWIAEMREHVDELGQRLTSEVEAIRQRLDAMMGRVQESLRRVDKFGPPVPEGSAGNIPWANDLLDFLDQRRGAGMNFRCALPDLFGHLKAKEDNLTVRDFHSGLRRLHDRGLLRLFASDSPEGPAEPEYALLDGVSVYYFAAPAA